MTGETLIARLADELSKTGEAHHQAFIATDGADPEWPLWYAEHLQSTLAGMLEHDVTRAEIVWVLVDAERHAPAGRPWPEAYARHIVDGIR